VFADYVNAILTLVVQEGFIKAVVEDKIFEDFRKSFQTWVFDENSKEQVTEKDVRDFITQCHHAGLNEQSCPPYYKRRPGECKAATFTERAGCTQQKSDTCGVGAVEDQMKRIIKSGTWQSDDKAIDEKKVQNYIGKTDACDMPPSTLSPLLWPCTSVQNAGNTEIISWMYATPAQVCLSVDNPWYRAPSPQNIDNLTEAECDAFENKDNSLLPLTTFAAGWIPVPFVDKPPTDHTGICCLNIEVPIPSKANQTLVGTYPYEEANGGTGSPAKGSHTCRPLCPQC
jgi:hypothetical protein